MSSTAAEMSPTRLPATAAAMPAMRARRVAVDELVDLGAGAAHDERPGRVAVPAVDDRADVDRHDLAVADHPVAGDAVDDLAVDRDAGARREGRRAPPVAAAAEVALERRDRPGRADMVLGEAVELAGRDARAELLLHEGEDLGDDPPGAAHLVDLPARLAGDHVSLARERRRRSRPGPRRGRPTRRRSAAVRRRSGARPSSGSARRPH